MSRPRDTIRAELEEKQGLFQLACAIDSTPPMFPPRAEDEARFQDYKRRLRGEVVALYTELQDARMDLW